MLARQSFFRLAIVISSALLLVLLSLELLRRSGPAVMPADTMLYPKVMSGVWVTGFEESSYFPGNSTIPDRNDARRYRLELFVSRKQAERRHNQVPKRGYVAYQITFLGRRTKNPVAIDCVGGRSYFFISDWILWKNYLGPIADPDLPVPRAGPYKRFKRSGEGGVTRQLEDQAFAQCSGSAPATVG